MFVSHLCLAVLGLASMSAAATTTTATTTTSGLTPAQSCSYTYETCFVSKTSNKAQCLADYCACLNNTGGSDCTVQCPVGYGCSSAPPGVTTKTTTAVATTFATTTTAVAATSTTTQPSAAPTTTSTTSSSIAPPPAATSTTTPSPAPSTTSTGITCPASDGTTYITGGKQFAIECYTDHAEGDLQSGVVFTVGLDGCMAACAANPSCVDVSFVPDGNLRDNAACYMKGSLNQASTANNVWGARLMGNAPASAAAGSITTVTATVTYTSVSTLYASTVTIPCHIQ